jgi:CRP-like cAMP-binding protein
MVDAQVLKGFALFRGLDDSELTRIAELCRERTLNEGDRSFREGMRATEVHLCRSGKIDIAVWVREPWNMTVTVHEVEAGEVFGWSGLVAPYTYTASAECVERAEEIYMKGMDLLDFFEQNPHIGYVVMRNLTADISARLGQTRQRLSMEMAAGKPTP